MTEPSKSSERVSASEIPLVLQRAAEIDAEGDSLSVEELTRVAVEAGIDPEATRKAISELLASRETASPPPPAPRPAPTGGHKLFGLTSPSRWHLLVSGAVGAAFGFVSTGQVVEAIRWSGVGGVGGVAFWGVIVYLALRTAEAMRRGEQSSFQLHNFTTWFGAGAAAWAWSYPPYAEEWIEAIFLPYYNPSVWRDILLAWIVTSIVGGLVVHFGSRDRASASAEPSTTPLA